MNSYFTIYDFMVKQLHLSGCDLLTYALIYSFSSNTREGCFIGSQDYIAACIGAKRQSVNRSVSRLEKAGLIAVTTAEDNRRIKKYAAKKATDAVTKSDRNPAKKATDTCHKSVHNTYTDTYKDKNYNTRRAQKRSEPSFDLSKAGDFSY